MKDIKNIHAHFYLRISCFIFWLVTCPYILGQAHPKRMMTIKDYDLWSELLSANISENGNWASYRLKYASLNMDTLTLQKIGTNIKYVFPSGKDAKFNGESAFGCIVQDTFMLKDLHTEKLYKKATANSFSFSSNHKFTAIFLKNSDQELSLEITNQNGRLLYQASHVTSYYFDPSGNGVIYSTSKKDSLYGVEIVLFKDKIQHKKIVTNHKTPFQNLVWKENSVAFIENLASGPVLYNYNIIKEKLDSLSNVNKEFPTGMKVSNLIYRNPIHSKDGLHLFFWIQEPSNYSDSSEMTSVEIWNSKDKLLYDFKEYQPYYKLMDKMAVWHLKDNTVIQITDRDLPCVFLSADYKAAFIYDPAADEPQSKQHGAYDLYYFDLQTSDKKCIINHYPFNEKPSGSPDGAFLAYPKDGQWWLYNIKKDRHSCLTLDMPYSFFQEDNDRPNEPIPYGIAGWTNEGDILLYDRFDIWKISKEGSLKNRLTEGREIQKTFRIKTFNSDPFYSEIESKKIALDLNKGVLLETAEKETGKTGLSYFKQGLKIKELIWQDKKITQVSKAENKPVYLYIEQNFSKPPRLIRYKNKPEEVFQSNSQQKHFLWPTNQRIEYIVNGKKTKGILFYPADYKPGLKYPMIVHIYERQFSAFNIYENPSTTSGDGFNVIHFTTNGYFVLLPDIVYEFGNLRESVTSSVLAAVDTVVAKGDVYSNKIGLIGHSFGGYETDLIITQTDRFAAAVAGAAWTDLVSTYLYEGPSFRRPDFFRAEDHQLRIGKSLYEDMPSYLNNSPVLLAANVKTPLLGWVGEEDRHIHSLQTKEFYLAMRRLKKEHLLLVYQGEGHTIDGQRNAVDLTRRIMEWFDHYLKDADKKNWMNSDFNR